MATFPVILAGQRVTASLLTSMLPLEATKPADQSVTSSTTLVNDTALTLPALVAGAQYQFNCYLDYEGGAQGSADLKWTWTVPTSATLRYQVSLVDTTGAVSVGITHQGSDTVVARTNGGGNLLAVTMTGTLFMSSTAAALTLRWAQNTSNATATIVHAQSYLELVRTA